MRRWLRRFRVQEESLEPLFQATVRDLGFDPFPGGVYETDPAWLDGIPPGTFPVRWAINEPPTPSEGFDPIPHWAAGRCDESEERT